MRRSVSERWRTGCVSNTEGFSANRALAPPPLSLGMPDISLSGITAVRLKGEVIS
jgi:hypothetical protein